MSAILQDTIFSFITDVRTDICVTQILAIVVRFYHDKQVIDTLLNVVQVEDGTARNRGWNGPRFVRDSKEMSRREIHTHSECTRIRQ